jgi:hypothetical protein
MDGGGGVQASHLPPPLVFLEKVKIEERRKYIKWRIKIL